MTQLRDLSIEITVANDGTAVISVTDSESGDNKAFSVAKEVNCNDADGLAQQIGYEILSWVDIARENLA